MPKISVYVPDQLLAAWREFTDDQPDISTSGVLQAGMIAMLSTAPAGQDQPGTAGESPP